MTAYPANFRCAQITPYSIAVDMGLLRTAMEGGNARQRRLYRNMPHAFALEFVMTVQELGDWQEWVNAHGYDYFIIDKLESYQAGKKGVISSPHNIRFTSNLAIDNPIYGWVRVKVAAELGGLADNPALAWIIAGTPAAPSTGQAPIGFSFMVPGTLPGGATLARSTAGSRITSTGAYVSEPPNVARWTYHPATLALQGLLNEPAATNAFQNSLGLAGLAPGSPGTPPTTWTATNSANGLVRTIGVGGLDTGEPYWTINYTGTPTTSGQPIVGTLSNVIPAAVGETWQVAWNIGLEPGFSLAGLTTRIEMVERDAALAALQTQALTIVPSTAPLPQQRAEIARTLTVAATVFVSTVFRLQTALGVPINVTARVSLPQAVKAEAQGSHIESVGVPLTRQADVLGVPLTDGTYSMAITRLSGTSTVAGATVAGGSYVVPTDFSPLQSLLATKTGPPAYIIAGTPAAPSAGMIDGGTPATWAL